MMAKAGYYLDLGGRLAQTLMDIDRIVEGTRNTKCVISRRGAEIAEKGFFCCV
jgi:hypothetical protein